MDIKSIFKNSIFRGGIVFFIGGMISNILNYLYRILMGRMLGPELFGELVAVISFLFILAVPSAPIQIAATRFSAILKARNSSGKFKNLFLYLTRISGLITLVLIILGIVFVGKIQDFLNLSSKNYIYFLIGITTVMIIAGVTKGILQGLKRFSLLSFNILLESLGRVVLAVIFVSLGFKVFGALVGFFFSLIFGYFISLYFLRDILSKNKELTNNGQYIMVSNQETREIWKYIFYSFLAFLLLNLLLNTDKILVKHYFSGFEAGIFSSISTLGQIVFLVISLIAGILFPIVVSKQAKKENYFYSLKVASLLSLLIGGMSLLIFFLFPKELLLLFFGKNYLDGTSFLGYYSLAMGILGFIFLLSYFFMALNNFKFLYILAAGTILEILLITLYHDSFLKVILMFSLALLFTLLGMGALIFLEKRRLLI